MSCNWVVSCFSMFVLSLARCHSVSSPHSLRLVIFIYGKYVSHPLFACSLCARLKRHTNILARAKHTNSPIFTFTFRCVTLFFRIGLLHTIYIPFAESRSVCNVCISVRYTYIGVYIASVHMWMRMYVLKRFALPNTHFTDCVHSSVASKH